MCRPQKLEVTHHPLRPQYIRPLHALHAMFMVNRESGLVSHVIQDIILQLAFDKSVDKMQSLRMFYYSPVKIPNWKYHIAAQIRYFKQRVHTREISWGINLMMPCSL